MAILTEDAFRLIGADGIGNHRAKVAHAMAWFRDALYLGCTHHRGEGPQDRARILRYTPASEQWDDVLESPVLRAIRIAVAEVPLAKHAGGVAGLLKDLAQGDRVLPQQ